MIIATAGHVDHGKTSLVNNLTGVDTDRLEEEKQRGLTIDLGFAYTDAETGGRLGFVDVPGHIRFINNMLAGVSAIDYCLLVIAADDGVMPQTIEHLDILELLGIQQGAIALTKIDRCDQNQISATTSQIKELVQGTFLESADIYPLSTVTGEGVEMLKLALDIASDEIEGKQPHGLFRLAIDRRFSVRGAGIVVTGSVFSGEVSIGDELYLMPQRIPVRVRGLHTQNQEAETAAAGDRCAVNIAANQLDLENISRGNWLTSNEGEATTRADLQLNILKSETRPFSHWTPVHIHTAANHVTGRVALLEGPRLAPGNTGLAQLVMDSPINICTGDRVVIRDQAALHTIGGGQVVDPWSPKRGRAKAERITELKLIDVNSAAATFSALTSLRSLGINPLTFAARFNLDAETMSDILAANDLVTISDNLVISLHHFDENKNRLTALLDNWHEENPTRPGLPLNQIHKLVRRWPDDLLSQVVNSLVLEEQLIREGNSFRRPGVGIQLGAKDLALWNAALPLLEADPIRPPVIHDLAKSLPSDPKQLEKTLNQLIKPGQLVKPVKNRFFLPAGIEQLKQFIFDAADDNGQFTVQQYRDVSGIGRNLSIELLEYFDRQGVTRRTGDTRQLVQQQR